MQSIRVFSNPALIALVSMTTELVYICLSTKIRQHVSTLWVLSHDLEGVASKCCRPDHLFSATQSSGVRTISTSSAHSLWLVSLSHLNSPLGRSEDARKAVQNVLNQLNSNLIVDNVYTLGT